MLSLEPISDQAAWDRAVLALARPHILQSWAWGETKAQTGWTARRLLWRDAERPVAAASILVRRLARRLPIAIAYAPKGPLTDWSDAALAEEVIATLEATARASHALFAKIDPDVRADTDVGRRVVAMLERRGWRPTEEQIQFRNTMVSDLVAGEEVLLAAMKPKWRYNIRLAERRGVTVRDGTPGDLPAFYAMYQDTGQRDGFLVRPYGYYRHVWEPFLAGGLAHLLLADVEGRPVAGLMLFVYGPTAWYFYGASTAQARELMPNHALQWAALRWARGAGCTRYDWWGAPDRLDESDPMWGVYRFKAGFGGEFVPGIGAWDYPVGAARYWVYTRAMPRLLALARRRHTSQGSGSLARATPSLRSRASPSCPLP